MFGISSGEHAQNVNVNVNSCVTVNVNVNVDVRVTASARVSVSVSVNVCRGSLKCGGVRADSHRSVDVDVARAGSRRREVRTVFGIIPFVCGFACAGR